MRQAESERLNAKLDAVREIGAARLGKAEQAAFSEALGRFYANVSPDEVVDAWISHQDSLRALITKDPDSNCRG